MPWFMTDDKFHSHKKVIMAAKNGVGPLGLWLIAGSWCADQLTDGFIPDYMAARLDPLGWEGHAADLVRSGLWVESKQGHDAGWQFHQWDERQPTRAEVEAKRAEARDRMSKVRAAKKGRSQDVRANESRTSNEHDANFARSSDEVRSTPALPSPTQPGSKEPSRPRKRGTQIPDPFPLDEDMKNWVRDNAPNVDGWKQHQMFIDHHRSKETVFKNWLAAWRNWMRKAQGFAEDNATRRGENLTRHVETNDERCTRHPRQLADFCSICDSETRGAS